MENLPIGAVCVCNSLNFIRVSGLLKGAAATRCHNLTLVMMNGEPRDIQEGEHMVHCVTATDWLLNHSSNH